MTALSALAALFGQLLGGVARMTVGWAVVILFGRVPDSRQTMLSGIGLAALVWITAVVGVVVPTVGDLVLTPVPKGGPVTWGVLRSALLVMAVGLPLVIGILSVYVVDAADRPKGGALLIRVLRGYPYAAVLAFLILFLAVLRMRAAVRSLRRGWESEHVGIIVKPGRYESVVEQVETALRDVGLTVERRPAPRGAELPPRIVALVGAGDATGVPKHLVELAFGDLRVLVYPSDVAIAGPARLVALARSAVVRCLASADVYQTTSKEAEQIEDRLTEIAKDGGRFDALDEILASLTVTYEEWLTLFRLRLQVEERLRRDDAAAAPHRELSSEGSAS